MAQIHAFRIRSHVARAAATLPRPVAVAWPSLRLAASAVVVEAVKEYQRRHSRAKGQSPRRNWLATLRVASFTQSRVERRTVKNQPILSQPYMRFSAV